MPAAIANVVPRHRDQLAPELVERVAVQAPRARLEARGVDEVRGADLGDVDVERGMAANEHAGRAGVVEVDVGEQEVRDVGELEASLLQLGLEPLDARGRPAVEERGPVVGLDHVRADRLLVAEVEEIDRVAGHAADRNGHATGSDPDGSSAWRLPIEPPSVSTRWSPCRRACGSWTWRARWRSE